MPERTRRPADAVTKTPAYKLGVEEGRRQVKQEILTHLEKKYVGGSFARKSPQAEAILTVVRDISSEINR